MQTRIMDSLTLIAHVHNAQDNAIFIKAGSFGSPYCAFSLREDKDMLPLLTWGASVWLEFESALDYMNFQADQYERQFRGRRRCVGCGRSLYMHQGDGAFAEDRS